MGACSIVLLHVFVSTSISVPAGEVRDIAYALLGIVGCRWAVPAFFMITGYLLLGPGSRSSWRRVRRYALRMVAVLATFGLAFALVEVVWDARGAGEALGLQLLPQAALKVLTMTTWDHLWYVYALVGVYLLVPPLCSALARVGRRWFSRLTGVLVAGVLGVPTSVGVVQAASGVPVDPNILATALTGIVGAPLGTWLANVAIGVTCACVGGCLHGRRLNAATLACGGISLASMVGTSEWSILRGMGDAGFVFLQGSLFACGYGMLVLLVLRRLLGGRTLRPYGPTAQMARDSFGVYVIHPFFIHLALVAVDPLQVPPGIFEAALFAFALLASVATTRLLRRVPLLGSLL